MLGIGTAAFLGIAGRTVFAADTPDISTETTKEEIQEIVDAGEFDSTELTADELEHIYSLYNNDPETIKQLQKQSDYNTKHTVRSTASLAAATDGYTHSSMFNGYTIQKGVDVSEWNGSIDWKKVKASGIDFAIIRAGGRYWGSGNYFTDSMFETNIKGAIAAGLDVGVYFYSQAISASEARTEAAYTMKLVSGYNINLPIVMDYEYGYGASGLEGRLYDAHLSRSAATSNIKAFCAAVESKGYVGMVYASLSVLRDDMDAANIARSYPVWLAQYNTEDNLTSAHSYWQYRDDGVVSGMSGACDMNFRYVKSPSAVSSLTHTATTDSTVTLSWTKVPEAYGYQIVRYDASKGRYVSVGTVKGASKLTYTDTGLADGKQYKYKVRAYYKLSSGNKYGTYSPECIAITLKDIIENLKVSSVTDSSVTLSWSPISVATGYRVYRYNASSGAYEIAGTITDSDTTSFTDTSLAAGTQYIYKVRAYTKSDSAIIWHTLSDKLTATTDAGQVSGLCISSTTSSSITLRWNRQTNVSGYIVLVWDDDASGWVRAGKVSGASTNAFSHKGLANISKHTYCVTAYYKKNGSYKYATRSTSVVGYTGPSAPSNVVVTSRKPTSVSIIWSKISNADGYYVYLYDTSSKSYKRVANLSGSSSRTYTFTGLTQATTYKFAVRAYVKNDGVLSYSEMKKYSTCTKPATFTTSFKYTPLGSNRCLTWQRLSGVSGYIVLRYNAASKSYTRVKKITNPATNYCFVPNVSSKYGYRIMAYKTLDNKVYYGDVSKSPTLRSTLTATITDSLVNVRSGAGTNYNVVTELPKNTVVTVTGIRVNSNGETWYKISYSGNGNTVVGYMWGAYLKLK